MRFIVGWAVCYLILLAALAGINQVDVYRENARKNDIRTAPTERWFEYKDIIFDGPTEDGRGLRFVSTLDINKDISVVWTDTLRCKIDSDDDYTFYSVSVTSGRLTGPEKNKVSRWIYPEDYPAGKLCILESDIVGDVEGYKKPQEFIGLPFTVPPPQ